MKASRREEESKWKDTFPTEGGNNRKYTNNFMYVCEGIRRGLESALPLLPSQAVNTSFSAEVTVKQ